MCQVKWPLNRQPKIAGGYWNDFWQLNQPLMHAAWAMERLPPSEKITIVSLVKPCTGCVSGEKKSSMCSQAVQISALRKNENCQNLLFIQPCAKSVSGEKKNCVMWAPVNIMLNPVQNVFWVKRKISCVVGPPPPLEAHGWSLGPGGSHKANVLWDPFPLSKHMRGHSKGGGGGSPRADVLWESPIPSTWTGGGVPHFNFGQ